MSTVVLGELYSGVYTKMKLTIGFRLGTTVHLESTPQTYSDLLQKLFVTHDCHLRLIFSTQYLMLKAIARSLRLVLELMERWP